MSVELSDADRLFDELGEGMLDAARRGLLSAAHRGVSVIQTEIIPARIPEPADRGIYRAGWRVDASDPAAPVIENREPHSVFIEEGVRAENVKPGVLMITVLAKWVVRKGIAPDGPEATQAAWAIARKMQRQGIFNKNGGQGLGVLRELVEKHLDAIIEEEVAREIDRALG